MICCMLANAACERCRDSIYIDVRLVNGFARFQISVLQGTPDAPNEHGRANENGFGKRPNRAICSGGR
jgi:hypothetical protein